MAPDAFMQPVEVLSSNESSHLALKSIPLVVDLDGSLVKSDTLIDTFFTLIRRDPASLRHLPFWLTRGKAYLKMRMSERVALNAPTLPYNGPLVQYLNSQHAMGRQVYLATGANAQMVQRISEHLGIFSAVFGSDELVNLTGEQKRRFLDDRFGEGQYEYVGNAVVDLPILMRARIAALANPSAKLTRKLRSNGVTVSHVFVDRSTRWKSILKTIRISQWSKNLLVLLPLILAHKMFDLHRALLTACAFLAFSCAASSAYVLNDLLDVESDRKHATKNRRPFPSGDISGIAGLGLIAILVMLAVFLTRVESKSFAFWLATYFVGTIAYSFSLKKRVLVDVLVLAGLYTARILAGGAAALVPVSPWLAGFSIFFFLNLAIVKRFSELRKIQEGCSSADNGRGYQANDVDQMRTFGTCSGYASVVVFTFYINHPELRALYAHPLRLWFLAPVLIYWISRVWLLAYRGEINEDPVVFALTDKTSMLVGVIAILIVVLAALK